MTKLLPVPEPTEEVLREPVHPWDTDLWHIENSRPTSGLSRSADPCAVTWCDRPAAHRSVIIDGWRQPTGLPICKSHHSRWRRSGKPELKTFVGQESASGTPFRSDPARPIAAIDMTNFPPRMRAEIRDILTAKITNGQWTLDLPLRVFLCELSEVTKKLPQEMSFLDHDEAWWGLRLATSASTHRSPSWYRNAGRGRLRAVLKFLQLSRITDPWAEDYWTPSRCNITRVRDEASTRISWKKIQTVWLKEATKSYASDTLRAGSMAWSTVKGWSVAVTLLDAYIVEAGVEDPGDLTRKFFRDYLAWVIAGGDTKTRRSKVTTAATVLTALRDDEYLHGVPDVRFLARGQNPVRKTRDPKPIPADVVIQIDRILATAPELTPTLRRLFWLFRKGGPRPSEATTIPVDAIRRTARGNYRVVYYMSKVDDWRDFPIREDLGEELLAQAAWVRATYGASAGLLFPSERKSTPAKAGFPGRCEPYTAEALRRRLRALFDRHELKPSSMDSGEYRGSQLHRFRHTIATELLNADWSQYEVQTYLNHRSPTMMQHYAAINDEKLAEKYKQSVGLIDKNGEPASLGIEDDQDLTVDRLAQKLMKASLPSGFCGLPEAQSCSFRPNPCLDCAFYRTGKAFLGTHIKHRSEVEAMITRAKADGNDRVVELNQPTLDHLNTLIPRIEASGVDELVGPR